MLFCNTLAFADTVTVEKRSEDVYSDDVCYIQSTSTNSTAESIEIDLTTPSGFHQANNLNKLKVKPDNDLQVDYAQIRNTYNITIDETKPYNEKSFANITGNGTYKYETKFKFNKVPNILDNFVPVGYTLNKHYHTTNESTWNPFLTPDRNYKQTITADTNELGITVQDYKKSTSTYTLEPGSDVAIKSQYWHNASVPVREYYGYNITKSSYKPSDTNENIDIKHYYDKQAYKVNVIGDEGIASTTGTGSYYPGDTVTVTCSIKSNSIQHIIYDPIAAASKPANGNKRAICHYTYRFKKWTGMGDSCSRTFEFEMPEQNVTVIATTERVYTFDRVSVYGDYGSYHDNYYYDNNHDIQYYTLLRKAKSSKNNTVACTSLKFYETHRKNSYNSTSKTYSWGNWTTKTERTAGTVRPPQYKKYQTGSALEDRWDYIYEGRAWCPVDANNNNIFRVSFHPAATNFSSSSKVDSDVPFYYGYASYDWDKFTTQDIMYDCKDKDGIRESDKDFKSPLDNASADYDVSTGWYYYKTTELTDAGKWKWVTDTSCKYWDRVKCTSSGDIDITLCHAASNMYDKSGNRTANHPAQYQIEISSVTFSFSDGTTKTYCVREPETITENYAIETYTSEDPNAEELPFCTTVWGRSGIINKSWNNHPYWVSDWRWN